MEKVVPIFQARVVETVVTAADAQLSYKFLQQVRTPAGSRIQRSSRVSNQPTHQSSAEHLPGTDTDVWCNRGYRKC